jgi:DNA-binding CsgD family transcriptional regulator
LLTRLFWSIIDRARRHESRTLGNIGSAYICLTDRQLVCLRWAAVGKSFLEIGSLMGIPEAAVRQDLLDVQESLGARSLIHAVCMSYEAGLIDSARLDCHEDIFRSGTVPFREAGRRRRPACRC